MCVKSKNLCVHNETIVNWLKSQRANRQRVTLRVNGMLYSDVFMLNCKTQLRIFPYYICQLVISENGLGDTILLANILLQIIYIFKSNVSEAVKCQL